MKTSFLLRMLLAALAASTLASCDTGNYGHGRSAAEMTRTGSGSMRGDRR